MQNKWYLKFSEIASLTNMMIFVVDITGVYIFFCYGYKTTATNT